MKIKSISCTQFAGIRNRSLAFGDGINLIYGKNESGKSTLVNLLFRTLFQNARIDGRRDKEFKELYFPADHKENAATGDFVDGTVTLDTENGIYTLTKEWGQDARCTLSTPDGVIRDQKKIDAILKEILLYGEGVYSDLLFSSQRNVADSLKRLLDASEKTDAKQEVTNAVSQAFAEGDGITADAIEQAIHKRIEEIAGEHWDVGKCAPVRKAVRWKKGLGEILTAYYAMEDANAILESITDFEQKVDTAAADYTAKDRIARIAEADYDRFHTVVGQLTVRSERRKAVDRLEKENTRLREILFEWPQLNASLEKAKALESEKEQRELLDKYDSAKKLTDEIDALRSEVGNRACPSDREIASVKVAQRKITTLENKLCGMNLSASIKMLGSNTVSITSLRTGQIVDVTDPVSITEAVRITVPGVMEMQLSPAEINVSEVKVDIADKKKNIADIFARYEVESLDAMEQLAKKISDNHAQIELLSSRLSMVLGAIDYTELKASAESITDEVRSKESVEQDICDVCGSSDILQYITAKETIVQGYKSEYGSIEALKGKAFDTAEELRKVLESVKDVQGIPSEYAEISDPEGYLIRLQNDLKAKQSAREAALAAKSAAVARLESYKENLSGDPVAEAEDAKRVFHEKKTLLDHWIHIAEVFAQQKKNVQNNPMQDLSDNFARYLGLISGNTVSSEFPDPEKLNMKIYSGNNDVNYKKLSEGTKETVSLAFRLAVLDHLFPDGGGVIVFDDPLTDMDVDRTAQSCKLIQECSKRHQVIFLTCKEEYAEMLGGNEIRI